MGATTFFTYGTGATLQACRAALEGAARSVDALVLAVSR